MTDHLGQSQVLPYLVGLSKMGHEIFLLSCEKRIIDNRVIESLKEDLKKENIRWSPLDYTKWPPVLSTMLDIAKIRKTAKRIVIENNIQIVHCRGYITAIAGLWLKRKLGLEFIFDMRGFFADERVEGGLWNLKNPVYKWIYNYFKKKEKLFFSNADYIVSLTEKAKSIIHSWDLPGQPLPIDVIPCCADLELFDRKKINETDRKNRAQKLKINESDFVISYLGSIGTWYMLDEMLDFFKVLLSKKPNAKFFFITSEMPEVILDSAQRKNISPGSIIIQKAIRKDVPVLISLSHISIFFIKPVFSKSASSPTKMGEIMGMGIPLICNSDVGDVETIMNDSKTGILLNSFNDYEYLKSLEKLDDVLKISPDHIREYAKKYYSLEDGIKKYHNIYSKLIFI
jgi:glycosyltransferase involved in cell wall biosynthesis